MLLNILFAFNSILPLDTVDITQKKIDYAKETFAENFVLDSLFYHPDCWIPVVVDSGGVNKKGLMKASYYLPFIDTIKSNSFYKGFTSRTKKMLYESRLTVIVEDFSSGKNGYFFKYDNIKSEFNTNFILVDENRIKEFEKNKFKNNKKKWFNKNKLLKNEFNDYRYEVIWYCFDHQFIVLSNNKGCYYEQTKKYDINKLYEERIKIEKESLERQYQSGYGLPHSFCKYSGTKYAIVNFFSDTAFSIRDTASKQLTKCYLVNSMGKKKKINIIYDSVIEFESKQNAEHVLIEINDAKIKIPYEQFKTGFYQIKIMINKNINTENSYGLLYGWRNSVRYCEDDLFGMPVDTPLVNLVRIYQLRVSNDINTNKPTTGFEILDKFIMPEYIPPSPKGQLIKPFKKL
ncbi:MAG: hypothetical protein NTZ59_00790 [Bacteroidetes bacterium]|nr:hypothetical protein [Bacteroidota bacterium]